jgi:hypothetical protein
MTYPKGGSEYGGYPGLIQPEPHDVANSPTEQLMLMKMTSTDPSDEDSPDKLAERIRAQGRADQAKQTGGQ